MKTFFIALILGIFVGSIITNYFANPDAYEKLKETKARLFHGQTEAEPTPIAPGAEEPAMFQVGSKEFGADTAQAEPSSNEAQTPIPLPPTPPKEPEQKPTEPAPTPSPKETEQTPTEPKLAPAEPLPPPAKPVTPPAEPAPAPSPPKEPAQTRAEKLIEEGTKQAEEIAETVKEKANEVVEETKPLIEEGIDFTIATAIRARYKIERRLDSDSIYVSVKDNIVTLSGSVPDESSKLLAIEIAAFTKGVNGVEETLSIAE